MKYKAIIETDEFKDFEFYEDADGKYLAVKDKNAKYEDFMALHFTECEQENSSTNFKDELRTLVAKRLDEINHFISGCDSPFTYLQIREVQELMCDIRTTLGIEEVEE